MNGHVLKGIAAAACAAVGAYFRQLTFPFALLLFVMVLDYLSGMTRAYIKGELSSKIGLRGIVKKVSYLFTVAVAVVVDFTIQIAGEQTALDLAGCYFCALLVIVWLIINECISILENAAEIGVPVPEFLVTLVKRLKQNTEKKEAGHDDGKTDR